MWKRKRKMRKWNRHRSNKEVDNDQSPLYKSIIYKCVYTYVHIMKFLTLVYINKI